MDGTAIVVATIALIGTGVSGWLAARAQSTSAAVQREAARRAEREAYVDRVERERSRLADDIESLSVEAERLRNELREEKHKRWRSEMGLTLVGHMLGKPEGWDPLDEMPGEYGRRATDTPLPPPPEGT